jgi:hypothetical protein
VSDPEASDPHAVKIRLDVPEIPRKQLFVVEPVLGRAAGPNLVVRGASVGSVDGDTIAPENSFEPLLVRDLRNPNDLIALTQACWVGGRKSPPKRRLRDAKVERKLRESMRGEVAQIGTIDLELDGGNRVHCQNIVDVLPGDRLPDGEYTFEASIRGAGIDEDAARAIRFAIGDVAMEAAPVTGDRRD